MLKEFFQYIINLGNTRVEEVAGERYSTQPLHLIRQATPNPIEARSLTGLVDYLVNDYDNQPPVMVHVASPTEVRVVSTFNRDYDRNHLLKANAMLPNIPFENFLDIERLNILLQSCFVPNEHRAALLRVIGNIKEENVTTVGDNGVAQSVVAKAGVAAVEDVLVPNPVLLKPFRTFAEIEQPESQFVFRMRTGPQAGLFEADGGAWKLTAMARIKDFLTVALQHQIEAEQVVIIA